DGVFANITFKIKGSAGKTANLSFQTSGAFGDADMQRITGVNFANGSVTIKEEELQDPSISPVTATFDKYSPADIIVALTANGNTFKGISGLTKGTDYTVSGNTVTLLKSYLSTLSLGTKSLTFDFGVSNNPTLSMVIKDSTPIPEESLSISVGTVSGKKDEIVSVPITIENVDKVGSIDAYGFMVRYDSTLIKPVAIKQGNVLEAISEDVMAELNSDFTLGKPGFMALAPEYQRPIYLSFNAFDNQKITEDGVLVYIDFEILGEANNKAGVSIDRYGSFVDGNKEEITNIIYTDGFVEIIGDVQLDPYITPTRSVFDKYSPSDITVYLTPNGNTFNGIEGLVEGRDYSVQADTVKIHSSYLSSLDLGLVSLVFDFGKTGGPSIAITIKDTSPVETDFNISIENITGKTGDIITVPITIGNISKVESIITCNFYVLYDDTLLEAISISSGDIVINPGINFASKVNQGSLSFLFLDNTLGDELITEDGVFATITFKILGTSKEVTPLAFTNEGAFGDGDMERIEIKKIDGSVQIN
ncbi:MAG: cellulosome anchor protein, partial [Clostridiales bacterium]|nr:cellulosome anchor protein [Clostridiales bacterium]